MEVTRLLTYGGAVIGVMILLGVSPVFLSYTTGDSMEPTIGQGDVIVVTEDNNIQEGDIIIFFSPDRGENVAHRVVNQTENGFITKGDGNPTIDQRGDIPPVKQDQIVGTVLTAFGTPITIPTFGFGGLLFEDTELVLLLLALLLIAPSIIEEKEDRGRENNTRMGSLVLPLFVIGMLSMVVLIQVGSATVPVAVLFVDNPTTQSDTIRPTGDGDATIETTFEVVNPPFSTRVVSTTGSIQMTEMNETSETTFRGNISINGRQEQGVQKGSVEIYNYPSVLPKSVLQALHGIHPLVSSVAVSAVMFIPVWLIYLLAIDPEKRDRIIIRDR